MSSHLSEYFHKEINDGAEIEAASHIKPVAIQDIFGRRSLMGLQKMLNPVAGIRRIYVTLDKKSAVQEGQYSMRWLFAIQGMEQGNINNIALQNTISNVVGIRLTAVFSQLVIGSSAETQVALSGRIGIQIGECRTQASTISNLKLHYLLKPFTAIHPRIFIQDTNLCNYGTYWFNPPIFSLGRITLTLFNPTEPINYDDIDSFVADLEIMYLGSQETQSGD